MFALGINPITMLVRSEGMQFPPQCMLLLRIESRLQPGQR